MQNSSIHFIVLIVVLLSLGSCDKGRTYEKNVDIAGSEWMYEDTVTFEVAIADTLPKNVFVNFRHGFYYGWRNAWLKLKTIQPTGEFGEQSLNVQLSQPDGQWYGDCSGDICMMRYPVVIGYAFPDTGTYTFQFVQDMRQNPLPEVMSIGLRVEEFVAIEQE
ncbi:MAG: gliding motility lipoprotein GldH [Chitinophagales bacterium]